MKNIFPRTIGTLQELGTARAWLRDAAGCALIVLAIVIALILL